MVLRATAVPLAELERVGVDDLLRVISKPNEGMLLLGLPHRQPGSG